ncbi:class I adenylate-forming enzyme family protein [Streptomyces sp. Wb2n-11]|uniref:class I adenylate-forming enzyme family protein n=1 Tax=Streptomyces sp. Wb2n-11 TaxID=1030533 RepID=UPI000B824030|nr:class I adenylate-forming enzyme family protein [Streptomyces sp. Wb2n-11]
MSSPPSGEEAAEAGRPETVHDLLRRRAEREPEQTAIDVAGAATLSFGQWEERSNGAARALIAAGVRRGTRVALLFSDQDWIDYAVAYLGVLKAGGTAVHLSDEIPPAEVRRRCAQTGPAGVVHSSGLVPPDRLGGWTRPVTELAGDTAPVEVATAPDDLADILYTSGTTGPAKAYTNPHSTLLHGRRPAGLRRFDNSAPLLAPMPMGTPSSAMSASLMPLNSPATVILCRPGDIETMGRLIAERGVATVMLTPWTAMRMVAAKLGERYDLTSVTTMAIASAPLPAPTALALRKMMPGIAVNTAYAQGEAVPAVVLGSYDPDRPLALGRPAPGTELMLAGPDGEPVPDGTTGEIRLRSPAARRRYLDEELDAGLRSGGWIRTRDLGRIGADGDLYLFDRMADAVPVGDRLVSTLEVENALYSHPEVREAAVLGVPGPEGGLSVTAVVVAGSPGTGPDETGGSLPDRLRGHLASCLNPYQIPSAVHVVDSLPRGMTGKVLKHRLRERLSPTAGTPRSPKGRNTP